MKTSTITLILTKDEWTNVRYHLRLSGGYGADLASTIDAACFAAPAGPTRLVRIPFTLNHVDETILHRAIWAACGDTTCGLKPHLTIRAERQLTAM